MTYKEFVESLDLIIITFVFITNLGLIIHNGFGYDFITVGILIISSIAVVLLYGTRREKRLNYK